MNNIEGTEWDRIVQLKSWKFWKTLATRVLILYNMDQQKTLQCQSIDLHLIYKYPYICRSMIKIDKHIATCCCCCTVPLRKGKLLR